MDILSLLEVAVEPQEDLLIEVTHLMEEMLVIGNL